MPPPSPIPAALRPWSGFLLAKAAQAVVARVDAALGAVGLRTRSFGCLVLLAAEGPLAQATIGERTRVDRTTTTAIVDELEGLGLVERRRNPADRRSYAVALTPAGEAALPRAREIALAAEAEALRALAPEEREALRGLLARMLD